jgi:hypothetical protein
LCINKNWSAVSSTQQGGGFSEVVFQSVVGGEVKYIRASERETTHHLLSLWSRSKEQIQQLLMHAFCPSNIEKNDDDGGGGGRHAANALFNLGSARCNPASIHPQYAPPPSRNINRLLYLSLFPPQKLLKCASQYRSHIY